MNTYAAKTMILNALVGERLIVIERDQLALRDAVRVFGEANEQMGVPARVRTANGAERVDTPGGGWIRFATPRGGRLRGMTGDVVFIDNDAHRVLYEQDGDAALRRFNEDVRNLVGTHGSVVYS